MVNPDGPAEEHRTRDRRRAEAVADLVEGAVEHLAVVGVERQGELARKVGTEVRDRDTDQRQAAVIDRRLCRGQQAAGDGEDDLRLRGRMSQRVRARRTREVREAQPKHDGSTDTSRCTQPTGDAVDERDEIGVDLLRRSRPPPERSLRPDRAATAARPHGPGIDVVRESVQVACRTPAEQRGQHGLVDARELADGLDAAGVQLRRASPGRRPTPARRAAGAGSPARPSSGTTSRPSGLASALATLARNFVRAMPDADRQPDPLADRPSQPDRDLDGRCRRSAPCRARRGTPRRSTAPRRAASCRRTPRRDPCSPACTPPFAAGRRSPRDRAGAPPGRPSPSGHRRPSPRSSPRARHRRRRSPGGRAAGGRRAARPTRRTSPRRHAGSSPPLTRTYVRTSTVRRSETCTVAPGASWPASGRSAATTTASTG